MKIINLTKKLELSDFGQISSDDVYLIISSPDKFRELSEVLNIQVYPQRVFDNYDENVRFETHTNFDFLSFEFFALQEANFSFELFTLYYGKNYLALILPDEAISQEPLMQDFIKDVFSAQLHQETLAHVYYKFLDSAFTRMFDALCRYENNLSQVEMDILTQKREFDFDRIVAIKKNSFTIKKCLRLLLYVGDQLLVNDNNLIPETEMRYFRNIDMRINRMYEYAANLHEVSEHLLDLYNSSVNSKTNDLINKLTIITVFATPLTVLTGIYGMNFVNIPELQHPYGYFILLSVMIVIILTTFAIMKKIKLL